MPEQDATELRATERNADEKARGAQEERERDAQLSEPGRLLALDLGHKRVGLAVCDELRISVKPLAPLQRGNWKELLRAVCSVLKSFDAKGLVLGLPLNMDGSEGPAAVEARRLAANFQKSLALPVYLQDERLTSREAEAELRAAGHDRRELRALVDSAAAAIILRDFLEQPTRASSSSTGSAAPAPNSAGDF